MLYAADKKVIDTTKLSGESESDQVPDSYVIVDENGNEAPDPPVIVAEKSGFLYPNPTQEP